MDKDKLRQAERVAAASLGVDPAVVEVRVRGRGKGGGRPHARTDAEMRAALAAAPSLRAAARALGVSDSTVRAAAARLGIASNSASGTGLGETLPTARK